MDNDTNAEINLVPLNLSYKRYLHDDITKILATTTLAFIEDAAPDSIGHLATLEERARYRYQNDPVFHARICQQVVLIMTAIDECDRQQ